jgi:hypothetical protein
MARILDLEIRHRIGTRGDKYVVIENFADQPAIVWEVPTRELAEALIASRKAMLLEMIANISSKHAKAVEERREIDNLKAGHA